MTDTFEEWLLYEIKKCETIKQFWHPDGYANPKNVLKKYREFLKEKKEQESIINERWSKRYTPDNEIPELQKRETRKPKLGEETVFSGMEGLK